MPAPGILRIVVLASLWALHSCGAVTAPSCAAGPCDDVLVYIGTQGGEWQDGPGRHGIYAARLEQRNGHLSPIGQVAGIERATWLVVHPEKPILYSVGMQSPDFAVEARIHSLGIDRSTGALHAINDVGAGGTDATHLDLGMASQTIFSANHGTGDVSAISLSDDGSLGGVASLRRNTGSGPHPRQEGPEMHAVAVARGERFVVGADFGADMLLVHPFDKRTRTLGPAVTPVERMPPGSGPRHLVFRPDGGFLYMNNEITAELRAYRWDPDEGRLDLVQSVAAYAGDYEGPRSAAEIVISPDGRFLYHSLRGPNGALVVFEIDARQGSLSEIQRVAWPHTPWSMALAPGGRWLLVANQATNTVAVVSIDPATGRLASTGQSIDVPKPVTIAFYPR